MERTESGNLSVSLCGGDGKNERTRCALVSSSAVRCSAFNCCAMSKIVAGADNTSRAA